VSAPTQPLGDDHSTLTALFEHLCRAYEEGVGCRIGEDDWPRLTALFERLDHDGIATVTPAEAAWLRLLVEDATRSLVRTWLSEHGVRGRA
jgi:hypothetical protein